MLFTQMAAGLLIFPWSVLQGLCEVRWRDVRFAGKVRNGADLNIDRRVARIVGISEPLQSVNRAQRQVLDQLWP